MSGNNVCIVGNLTGDPEMRFTPSGAAVANFNVAVNRRKKNGDRWDDELEGFFRCTAWKDLAENVSESLFKGARVIVTGRLQQRSWDDNDGTKRSAVEILVDDVGPSLRWATAQVAKANRQSGQGQASGSPARASSGGDSW
jgi:single-strand DNA-binding protein